RHSEEGTAATGDPDPPGGKRRFAPWRSSSRCPPCPPSRSSLRWTAGSRLPGTGP
ncbi:hypothetical protein LLOABG_LLOABG_05360, partial [Dysosmobacter welbionis]